MKNDVLVNVFGCYRCAQLAGDLRRKYVTETRQGYEICPLCNADLDAFWINLTTMSTQESRIVKIMDDETFRDKCILTDQANRQKGRELNTLVDSVLDKNKKVSKSWWRNELPKVHGNKKYRTAFSKGTGLDGKTVSQIRKMARKSSQNLVKALKKSDL